MSEASAESSNFFMRLVFGRNPKRTLVRLLLLIVVATVIFKFLLLPIQVSGLSMEPTYINGKINFVNRMAYSFAKPKRGDVVAVRMPATGELILKRIVGLPGERVAIISGAVRINGEFLKEPYVMLRGPYGDREKTIEPEHYFVIGDNRKVSIFLQVPQWNIIGKVLL